MLIIGSDDSRVSSLGKGLSFEVEARRGSLDMGTSTVEVSSKACTPRARWPLNGGLRSRGNTHSRKSPAKTGRGNPRPNVTNLSLLNSNL